MGSLQSIRHFPFLVICSAMQQKGDQIPVHKSKQPIALSSAYCRKRFVVGTDDYLHCRLTSSVPHKNSMGDVF